MNGILVERLLSAKDYLNRDDAVEVVVRLTDDEMLENPADRWRYEVEQVGDWWRVRVYDNQNNFMNYL